MPDQSQKLTTEAILLLCLFFLTPLIFSHLFSLVGITVAHIPFGYERYKSSLLSIGVILTGGVLFYRQITRQNLKTIATRSLFFASITVFGCLYWLYFRGNSLSDIIIGTPEKHHGALFFLSLGGLFWSIQKEYSPKYQEQLIRGSIYAACLVCLYALGQSFGLDPLGYQHDGWDVTRVFASLGNPDYLAGYLVMLFPMASSIFSRRSQTFLFVLFSLVILLTGSIIGIVLTVGYLLWKILGGYTNTQQRLVFFILLLAIGSCLFLLLPHEKILSMEARFSLWQESFRIFSEDPWVLLFGNGPDTIHTYILSHGIMLDPVYFASSSVVDSFHNIMIDVLFFFGLPVVIFGLIFLVRSWKDLPLQSQEGIILFFLFFSANVVISVHFLLLVLYLTDRAKK